MVPPKDEADLIRWETEKMQDVAISLAMLLMDSGQRVHKAATQRPYSRESLALTVTVANTVATTLNSAFAELNAMYIGRTRRVQEPLRPPRVLDYAGSAADTPADGGGAV